MLACGQHDVGQRRIRDPGDLERARPFGQDRVPLVERGPEQPIGQLAGEPAAGPRQAQVTEVVGEGGVPPARAGRDGLGGRQVRGAAAGSDQVLDGGGIGPGGHRQAVEALVRAQRPAQPGGRRMPGGGEQPAQHLRRSSTGSGWISVTVPSCPSPTYTAPSAATATAAGCGPVVIVSNGTGTCGLLVSISCAPRSVAAQTRARCGCAARARTGRRGGGAEAGAALRGVDGEHRVRPVAVERPGRAEVDQTVVTDRQRPRTERHRARGCSSIEPSGATAASVRLPRPRPAPA